MFASTSNEADRLTKPPLGPDACSVLQLVQSLEMLQLLGVNKVVIYKTNCSLETQNVLDYYTHKGRVWWDLFLYVHPSDQNNVANLSFQSGLNSTQMFFFVFHLSFIGNKLNRGIPEIYLWRTQVLVLLTLNIFLLVSFLNYGCSNY